ncbi:MAG: lysylphosphatidylglycerol synthase domain-containing protein, partial [Bacteroidia bacterium]
GEKQLPSFFIHSAECLRTIEEIIHYDLEKREEVTSYSKLLLSDEAVVVGITAGIFTPNGIGAYAGRVFWLKAGKRWEAAVLTLGDRLCQMTITLWTALFALEAIRLSHAEILEVLPQGPLQGGRILLWVTSGIALLLILFPQSMYRTILWIGANGKISGKIASAFAEVKRPLLAKVLLLGLLRYATFSLQYLILLYAFGYAGSMMLGVGLIGLVFFIKSLLPSISFSELGVRESVALVVMGAAGIAAPTAVAATFVLYLFNQIVPALAGLLLAPRLRVD